jgi:hypothetical protein
MTDFYSELEEQLLAAGRRRQAQGPVARAIAGRGRVLAVATAAVALLVVAVALSLPNAVTSVFDGGPTVPAAPPPAPAPAPAPPPAPGPAVSLAGIRVAVYNATTQQGAARGAGDELRARHAEVAVFGSMPSQPGGRSIVQYVPGAEAKARRVASVLGISRVEQYDPQQAYANPPESARAAVIVIVGYDRDAVPAPGAAGYPNAIALLGDSAAGENSWATGTNPAVNSVYSRILARNGSIGGHNTDLTSAGANADALPEQAQRAVKLVPKPELFVLQITDDDIACPLSQLKTSAFASSVGYALDILATRAPQAKVFVVGRFGSPAAYARALTAGERRSIGGTGTCDFIDPRGRVMAGKLAAIERVIDQYEFRLDRQCRRFAPCRYDRGAFARIPDRRAYYASDLEHLSVQGQAKAAAVAWTALQGAGIIPR